MASIRQIYEPKNYSAGSRRTLGDLFDHAYIYSEDGGVEGVDKYPDRLSRHQRSPWIVSCKSWLHRGRYIPLFVNPSDAQWSMPRRGTVQKTAAGVVRNTWYNRFRGTYFDEFTINLTFQTGNIMPSSAYAGKNFASYQDRVSAQQQPKIPPGLGNFYEFLNLLDQPKLLSAYENRRVIIMHTRVFPVLRLEGFFTEDPVTFSESDRNANMLTWTATFQVYATYPKITNASQMYQVYREFMSTKAWAESVPGLERLESAGDPFKEGIDANTDLPKGSTTSRGSGYLSRTNDFKPIGGSTRSSASTLQTQGSAARSQNETYSGEVSDNDAAHSFIFGR